MVGLSENKDRKEVQIPRGNCNTKHEVQAIPHALLFLDTVHDAFVSRQTDTIVPERCRVLPYQYANARVDWAAALCSGKQRETSASSGAEGLSGRQLPPQIVRAGELCQRPAHSWRLP